MKHSPETLKLNNDCYKDGNPLRDREKWQQLLPNKIDKNGNKAYSLGGTLFPQFCCAYGLTSIYSWDSADQIEEIVRTYGKPFLFSMSGSMETCKHLIEQRKLKHFRVLTETQSWHGNYLVSLLICEVNE